MNFTTDLNKNIFHFPLPRVKFNHDFKLNTVYLIMKLNLIIITIIIFSMFISACTTQKTAPVQDTAAQLNAGKFRTTPPIGKISSWGFLLQNPSVATLADSSYQLLVMDYSKDGSDSKMFSAKDIAAIHKFNKIALCYFSIGEAEDYRFYWQKEWKENPPKFLGPENPAWVGNFKVKYWREDWWETGLRPYLDRILEAGFDGIYMDIIDAYWYWHEQGMDVQTTSDEMVKLIKRIADYCRKRAGKNFVISPQNGMGVFTSCSPEYKEVFFNTIDMVGLESLLYNYYSEADRDNRLKLAKEIADAGKIVLDIEYIKPSQYKEYLKKVRQLDFPLVPYASTTDAALNRLTDFYKYRN